MRIGYALMLALAPAMPAFAQTAASPAPAAVAPEPARLAASKALMDLMLPPERRDAMIRGMIEPMIANIRSGLEASPQFGSMLSSDPKARDLVLAFVDRQMKGSIDAAMESMPALLDAMAVSYARRFTVAQIKDIAAFYGTPTGRELVEAMPSLMAAPEIAAVQKSMMSTSLERVQAETAQLVQQLAALKADSGKATP